MKKLVFILLLFVTVLVSSVSLFGLTLDPKSKIDLIKERLLRRQPLSSRFPEYEEKARVRFLLIEFM